MADRLSEELMAAYHKEEEGDAGTAKEYASHGGC